MTLGQRIQEYRKKNNLSQEALGEKLGVSRQAISKWESDLTIPELDKLIALSKLFGVSLNGLLGVEGPEEAAEKPEGQSGRDRRLVRLLAGLCAVLTLAAAASLGSTLYFRHQVMQVLNPPQAPVRPVTEMEYAFQPDYEGYTFHFAAEVASEELKGWDVTIGVYSAAEKTGGLVETEQEITFRNGIASVYIGNIPFRPRRTITVSITYTKGGLEGRQTLLELEPRGPGSPWEQENKSILYGFSPEENPELLED